MPELSQDAIRELRQTLPLIKSRLKAFAHIIEWLNTESDDPFIRYGRLYSTPIPLHDIIWLEKVSGRVRALTSPEQFEAWVGGSISYDAKEQNLKEIFEDKTLTSTNLQLITDHLYLYTERLYFYVQGVLQSEQIEKTRDDLTQENINLKEQLAELHRRESVYLSMINKAQASAPYALPQERKEVLDSLKRERSTLIKNLRRLEETKAQYGPLDIPLHIQNAIDQTQEDLKRVEARIAYLEASKTDVNRSP